VTSSTPHSSPRSASQQPAGRRRRIVAAAASLLLAAAGVVAVAGPASAHDQLISTNPADGSTLAKLPSQVTLTFGELVLNTDGGTQVKVTDAAGKTISSGPTVVRDNVVSQAVAGTATGTVTVLWRVVSEDGHPVSGEFSFTVQGAGTTLSPVTTSSPSPTAAPAPASSATPVLWVIGGIVLVVVVVIVIAVLATRRRPTETGSSDDRES
jgi:methionine-rich copper-binding protein CopC